MPLPRNLIARQHILPAPRVHMQARPPGQRASVPLCGQRSATGNGYARTAYTDDIFQVTCLKCTRKLKAGAA